MSKTLAWIEVLSGIWLIIAPWVLGFSAAAGATWDSVIMGLIVSIVGLIWAFSKKEGPTA